MLISFVSQTYVGKQDHKKTRSTFFLQPTFNFFCAIVYVTPPKIIRWSIEGATCVFVNVHACFLYILGCDCYHCVFPKPSYKEWQAVDKAILNLKVGQNVATPPPHNFSPSKGSIFVLVWK